MFIAQWSIPSVAIKPLSIKLPRKRFFVDIKPFSANIISCVHFVILYDTSLKQTE